MKQQIWIKCIFNVLLNWNIKLSTVNRRWPSIYITRNTFCRTRSLSNATFSFLITWRSSSSKSATAYKISSKSDDFLLRYGDISIFKMAAVRHLGIVLPTIRDHPRSLCCWPQLPVKFHVNLMHRSEPRNLSKMRPHSWQTNCSVELPETPRFREPVSPGSADPDAILMICTFNQVPS